MPLYDFKCQKCSVHSEHIVKYELRNKQICPCGGIMELMWVKGHMFHPFKERVFSHFGPDEVLVTSKKQLKRLCKEHDCTSVYLADS